MWSRSFYNMGLSDPLFVFVFPFSWFFFKTFICITCVTFLRKIRLAWTSIVKQQCTYIYLTYVVSRIGCKRKYWIGPYHQPLTSIVEFYEIYSVLARFLISLQESWCNKNFLTSKSILITLNLTLVVTLDPII